MQYCYYGKSDPGRKRNKNEDFILDKEINESEHIFIVSDGMGGHQAGEIASKLASITFVEEYQRLRKKNIPIPETHQGALKKANNIVFNQSHKNHLRSGMGTTLSVLVIKDNRGFMIHVGDSRIYQIRNTKLIKMTPDHTLVEKLLKDGHITQKEARKHPRRNILYQSVGIERKIKPYLKNNFEIQDGDIYLMCSDGLSNMVDEKTIKETAMSYFPKEAVLNLIKKANKNGGHDNISIHILKFNGFEEFNKTDVLKRYNKKSALLYILLFLLLIIVFFLIGI